MKKIEDEEDPLSAMIDYWLKGNVVGSEISWKTIVAALKAEAVGEMELADEIATRYCQAIFPGGMY